MVYSILEMLRGMLDSDDKPEAWSPNPSEDPLLSLYCDEMMLFCFALFSLGTRE
jgi:hypothetical protein